MTFLRCRRCLSPRRVPLPQRALARVCVPRSASVLGSGPRVDDRDLSADHLAGEHELGSEDRVVQRRVFRIEEHREGEAVTGFPAADPAVDGSNGVGRVLRCAARTERRVRLSDPWMMIANPTVAMASATRMPFVIRLWPNRNRSRNAEAKQNLLRWSVNPAPSASSHSVPSTASVRVSSCANSRAVASMASAATVWRGNHRPPIRTPEGATVASKGAPRGRSKRCPADLPRLAGAKLRNGLRSHG